MTPAPIPDNETERLARLRELFVLDSKPEAVFDSIALMASEICGTPVALISLVDGERQWFKAKVGIPGIDETPRDIAFCGHAILADTLFEIPDALEDARFADNPLVTGEQGVRFYAGAPLKLATGERIGTLCVIDRESKKLTTKQGRQLRALAAMATEALTMRRDLISAALLARTTYEQTLMDTSAEIADLYDNAPCAYHSLDADGVFVRANKTALRWLGTTREELIGRKRMSDFLTQAGLELFRTGFPKLVSDGRLDNFEFDLVGAGGASRRVIASATTVKDADGRFLMTRTVSYDISELMQVKDELRRVNHEQQSMLDTDLIGIVKLKDRHVTWANKGVEHMMGYAPGELIGLPSRVVYADEAAHLASGAAIYPTVHEGKPIRTELKMKHKDGHTLWIDTRVVAMPGEHGEVMCLLVDITPMKQAEEVRIRTLALEAENRQLVESNRVKGLFLQNMSHELHTPLNAVIGYAHLLQSGAVRPDSPKFASYLSQIAASGRSLLGLIDTMLNFAKVESGKFEFKPEPVDVRHLVRDVIEMVRADALAKRIELAVDIDPSLGEATLDEMRLTQVISHYLSNAIKFSREGGRVEVRALAANADHFRVEVEDQGIGIAESDLPRLFTAFQQISEGRSKAYEGAGLSLALTKRLVEAQGGSVGVTSTIGEGSVFHLVLPLRPAEAVAAAG